MFWEKFVFRKDLWFYKLLYRHSAILWQIHIAWSTPFPAASGSIISYSISTGKVSRKKLIWITFNLNSVSIWSNRQLYRILSRYKLFRRKSSSSFPEEIRAVKVYNFKSNNWGFVVKISWYEFLASILESYLWRNYLLVITFWSFPKGLSVILSTTLAKVFCRKANFGIIASKIYHCYIIIIHIKFCFTLSFFFYILHWAYIFFNLYVSLPKR